MSACRTLKDPRRFVDQYHPQALGVVCFEAFDHELDWRVILARRVSDVIASLSRMARDMLTMFAIEKSVMSNTIVLRVCQKTRERMRHFPTYCHICRRA